MPTVAPQHNAVSTIFSPDSTRLLLVDREGYAATLDTTHGMKNVKLIPPVSRLRFYSGLPYITLIANDGTTALSQGGVTFEDDEDDDYYASPAPWLHNEAYFLFNSTPGASSQRSNIATLVGNFTQLPVRIRDGQYLLAVSLTSGTVDTHLITTSTGSVMSTASLPKPQGFRWYDNDHHKANDNLQLCALPSGFKSDGVIFVRGRAHAIAVHDDGDGSPFLAIHSDGTPTGVANALCGQRDGAFMAMLAFPKNGDQSVILLDEA